jgi:hypothetical protein
MTWTRPRGPGSSGAGKRYHYATTRTSAMTVAACGLEWPTESSEGREHVTPGARCDACDAAARDFHNSDANRVRVTRRAGLRRAAARRNIDALPRKAGD